MELGSLFTDQSKKSKEKTGIISQWLSDGTLTIADWIAYAEKAKPPAKATCIEAMESATKLDPSIANEAVLNFVTAMLADHAPRVKWESAKVIGNIARCFPTKLSQAIVQLLNNTEHPGTVVRWATAYALSEIAVIKTTHQQELLETLEALSKGEENNGVRKKYLEALKKAKK